MRAMFAGLMLIVAGVAQGQGAARADSGGFLTRIGSDTLAVERWVRSGDSIFGDYVTRSPKTTRGTYLAQLASDGSFSHFEVIFEPTGTRMEVTRDGSVGRYTVARAGHKPESGVDTLGASPGVVVPLLEPAFGMHQLLVDRALAAKGAPVPFTWAFVVGWAQPGTAVIGRTRDTVLIETPTDTIHVAVDGHGRVLAMSDVGGTLQATVVRIPWPNIDTWQTTFAARDAAGKGLGTLSPRDTVRATVGAAHVLVDYSRPTRRGRVIFGGVVPFNTVWRTGANAATTLVTDRDLVIGETPVPAGTYTLFSVPAPKGWQLIVSKLTGEWGTDYDPKSDLARIPMTVDATASPIEKFTIAIDGADKGTAALTLAWDTTVARVSMRAADAGATTGR